MVSFCRNAGHHFYRLRDLEMILRNLKNWASYGWCGCSRSLFNQYFLLAGDTWFYASSYIFQCLLHLSVNVGFYCASATEIKVSVRYPTADHSGRAVYELSSLARTLGSWIRIPLKAWLSVFCAFILCLCCSVCRQRSCDGVIPCPRSPTDSV
jgi:hypothetical protein